MKLLRRLVRVFKSRGVSKTLKLCPVCNSLNIRLATKYSGWLTPETYVCDECGYSGPIYLEIDLNSSLGKSFEENKHRKESE